MKSSAILQAVYKGCLDRGYVSDGDKLYPPNHPEAIRILKSKPVKQSLATINKTGRIDDDRNIKNKDAAADMFMRLVKIELGLDVWPEFYFSTERAYRFDYAIPEYKIAIEQEGGIHMKGNSGHSSGTGIQRDMDKNNLALSQGWVIIRRTPDQICTTETIELIKSVIKQRVRSF
jgi:hypothetical protein